MLCDVKIYIQDCHVCAYLCSADVDNEEHIHSSPCLPNELLLSLFHSSLEQELNDREIPLANSDHINFMHHMLERERDGHVAPFSLPVIKGEYMSRLYTSQCVCLGERLTSIETGLKGDDMHPLVSTLLRYKKGLF